MMLVALLAACSLPEPPKPEAPPAPTCSVKVDALAGTAWIHMKPQPVGPDQPNPMARLRFRDDGGKLVADYTANSAGSVYAYDCSVAGQIATCLERDTHATGFCKAYAATHDGVCDPAGAAAATGIPQAEFDKVAKQVNTELKKLKKTEAEQQRKSDNNPNNKLRGKFRAALDPATCSLTLQDKYQTLVDGKLNEFENVLGNAKMVKAEKEYLFESCEDADSAWAPGPDDSHLAVQAEGTIKFSAMLQAADRKKAAGCALTADVYQDWLGDKVQSAVPATEDPKWGPRWDVNLPVSGVGKHVVYFDRWKTCGEKRERIGFTCALIRIGAG